MPASKMIKIARKVSQISNVGDHKISFPRSCCFVHFLYKWSFSLEKSPQTPPGGVTKAVTAGELSQGEA